jgi:CHAD domain-containing protein
VLGLGTLDDWSLLECLSDAASLPTALSEDATVADSQSSLEAAIRVRVAELIAGMPGRRGLAEADADRIHDLRVSLRRLRSLLETDSLMAAGVSARPARGWLGRLARRAGRVRDLDVQIAAWKEDLEALPGAELRALEAQLRGLRRQRRRQLRRLRRRLGRPRLQRRLQRLGDWSRQPLEAPDRGADLIWLRESLQRVLEHPARAGVKLLVDCPPRDLQEPLHDWRKQFKRLRYRAETMAIAGVPLPPELIDELKQVQDCLGGLQDLRVWRQTLAAECERPLPTLEQRWQERERQHWRQLCELVARWTRGEGALMRLHRQLQELPSGDG